MDTVVIVRVASELSGEKASSFEETVAEGRWVDKILVLISDSVTLPIVVSVMDPLFRDSIISPEVDSSSTLVKLKVVIVASLLVKASVKVIVVTSPDVSLVNGTASLNVGSSLLACPTLDTVAVAVELRSIPPETELVKVEPTVGDSGVGSVRVVLKVTS